MEKVTKEEHISFVKDLFAKAECLVLTNVEGLNASEISTVRRGLHEANIGFKVVKNKLARKALADTSAQALSGDFVGSTAIAWSIDDAVAPARVLVKFAKDFEKLQLKAGFSSKARLDISGVKALSTMPSLDELRGQLLGLFTAPASRLLSQINAPASHIVGVLQAKMDKDKEV